MTPKGIFKNFSNKKKMQSDILEEWLCYISIFSIEGCFKIIFIFEGREMIKTFTAHICRSQGIIEVGGMGSFLIKVHCLSDFVMFALSAF